MTRPRMTCPRCGRDVAAVVRLALEGQRLRVPARHKCKPPSGPSLAEDVERVRTLHDSEDIDTRGKL